MLLILQSSILKHKNDFINSIIKTELLRYIKLNLSDVQQNKWNSYLKNNYDLGYWNISKILVYAVDNLSFTTSATEYIGYWYKGTKLPDTKYELNSMISLIDKGNLNIQGTHLVTNSFNYLKENIHEILIRKVGY